MAAALIAAMICASIAQTSSPRGEDSGEAQILREEDSRTDDTTDRAQDAKEESAAVVFLDPDAFSEAAKDSADAVPGDEALTYYGVKLPFAESENTFYLSVSREAGDAAITEQLSLLKAGEGAVLYLEKDDAWGNFRQAVREGHSFRVLIGTAEKKYRSNLVLTGLPTLSVSFGDGKIRSKEEHEGEISVIDALRCEAGTWNCGFRLRGSTSVYFDKKNYRVELHKEDGSNKKVSLLGMRSDDDWVLNAMCSDATFAREKVCYRLWEDVNSLEEKPVAGSRIEYSELFINGEYMGLYGVMEPVDGRMMGLREGDLLYKIQNWRDEEEIEGSFTDYNGQPEIYNTDGIAYAKIQYPVEGPQYFRWDLLEAYERFVLEDNDPQILEDAGIVPDTENYITHNLFCVLTHASDNTWKNLLLACRLQPDGTYEFSETVWDLNYTFGDIFTVDWDEANVAFDSDTAQSMKLRRDKDFAYCALEEADPTLAGRTAEKWRLWRDSGLTGEYIASLFDECREELEESGAYRREKERWGINRHSGSFEETGSWIDDRIKFLDRYYEYGD